MTEASEVKKIPPYLTYTSFKNFVEYLGKNSLPLRIDRSVMSNLSGSTQSWIINALRFFQLIDESECPTTLLRDLISAQGEQRQNVLSEIVRNSYSDLLEPNFEVTKATLAQLEEKFRERGAAGSTITKCISFFLAACEDSGIEVSPHFVRRSVRVKSNGNGSRRRKVIKPVPPPVETTSNTDTPSEICSNNDLLLGLIKELPKPGNNFSKIKRDRWFRLASAIFDSIYIVDDENKTE